MKKKKKEVLVIIREALQSLQSQAPPEASAPLIALAFAAQGLGGGALAEVATENPDWAAIGPDATTAVIRLAAAYFVLGALEEGGLRTYFAEWLDCKPSEVESQIWSSYRDGWLSAPEAKEADKVVQCRWENDAENYVTGLVHLVGAASDLGDRLADGEAPRWRHLLERYQVTVVPKVRSDVTATLKKYEQHR